MRFQLVTDETLSTGLVRAGTVVPMTAANADEAYSLVAVHKAILLDESNVAISPGDVGPALASFIAKQTGAIMLSSAVIPAGSYPGALIGRIRASLSGSITLTDSGGGRVALSGRNLVTGLVAADPGVPFNVTLSVGGESRTIAIYPAAKAGSVGSSKLIAIPRTPTVLNATSTHTGATAVSAGVLATETYPEAHPSGATSGLSVSCLAADTFAGVRLPAALLPANFKLDNAYLVGLWVYWTGTNGSVALRFTSDNFATKLKTFSFAWSGQLHRGWNLLTVDPKGVAATNPGGQAWTVAGGFLDSDTVNGIEVQISTNGAAETKIYLGGLFYHTQKPTRGGVMLGFDKYGESSIPSLALPIIKAAGFRAYWAGDANLIESNGSSWTYLSQVYAEGWDAITQGKDHGDYTQPANKALLASHIDYARGIMRARGLTRALNMFSYPLSANDDQTDAILAAKGVPMARSGWAWTIHPNEYGPGPKLLGHGAINIGGKTLATVKAAVDMARYLGVTIDLFCHGLTPGGTGTTPPADPLYWYASDYQALVTYIKGYTDAGELDCLTPTEFIARRQVAAVA